MNKQISNQLAMLESILNGMDALITVCDSETFEILFINDSIREHFGIKDSGVGQLCYKLLQGLDEPCPTCPYQRLREAPENTLVWEHKEVVKGTLLRKTARLIDWPGGRKAHLEYAVDITEVRKTQDALEQREKQLEHQNRLLYAVNSISSILLQANTDTFDNELLSSMEIIAKTANVDRVNIWKNRITSKGHYFSCERIFEWPQFVEQELEKKQDYRMTYSKALPSWKKILSEGSCVNCIVDEQPEIERAYLYKNGFTSVLAVPIFLKSQFWGFISFGNYRARRVFPENEEKILRSAGEIIANALLRNRYEKNIHQLEDEAYKIYYDSLTGIYNRRFVDEKFPGIMRSLSRSGGLFSMMMVDIDYFKKYNDTYGHILGDSCLKIIANTLRKNVERADDVVARYGGEEFIVMLPNTDEAGAHKIARRLLDSVRLCNIPHKKSSAAEYVTVSIGAVAGQAVYTSDCTAYIQQADAMLYESKQHGRNKYTFKKLDL